MSTIYRADPDLPGRPRRGLYQWVLTTARLGTFQNHHVLHRIDEAARYVPVENLTLSPQRGFASTASGSMLTQEERRHKLELVVDTARKVWG